MENKIKKLYLLDLIAVIFFLAFLWITLISVLISVIGIVNTLEAKYIILIIGLLTGLYASSTLLALITHLTGNKNDLYTVEIKCSEERKILQKNKGNQDDAL